MTSYQIVTLLIEASSAIATFCAVCVALWQSRLQFKRDIQVAYNNNVGCVKGLCPESVEFLIYNAGNTRVSIYNIYLGKHKKYISLGEEGAPLFLKPKIIDIGGTISYMVSFDVLISAIKFLVKRDAKLLNKKIIFTVEDISGKKFRKKIEHTYNDYLLWSENKVCLLPHICN